MNAEQIQEALRLASPSDLVRALKEKQSSTHGGRRPGAGRPISDAPRCSCGAYTLKMAKLKYHKCVFTTVLARPNEASPSR